MVSSVNSFADAVAPIRIRHRRHITAARAWAFTHDVVLPADLVALIVAASLECAFEESVEPVTCWTRPSVNRLLMIGLPNWCSHHRVPLPFDAPEAVWAYLDFLVDTGRLHPDSDPITELRRPLRCYGQLDESGHWDPDGDPITQPCACYFPYDGPTHGELAGPVQQGERSGEW